MYRGKIDGTELAAVAPVGLNLFPITPSRHGPPKQPDSASISIMRAMDVALSLAAMVFLLPIAILVVIFIKIQDGGPVFFAQERIGKGGRRFRCWKFRSMHVDAETRLERLLAADPVLRDQWDCCRKLKDDPRITVVGDFLRRSSLDEIPQLFNIVRGDMSMVGPRPIVPPEAPSYGRWLHYYISVKPGLTGLWQVSGRNDVDYRRRIAMDRFFHRKCDVALYIYIIAATVPAVLFRRGSY